MAAQETMVKRTLIALAAALVASAGWGLGARESTALSPDSMAFPGVRPSPFASLLRHGGSVAVVYADRDTTSLRVIEIPVDGALPKEAPRPVFVDKVDIVSPLGGSFGLHASAVVDGRLHLLYLDREKEDRPLLKRVREDAGGWRLELVEPFGPPVGVLVGVDGRPMDVWAPGSLLLRGETTNLVLRERCVPRGQAVLLDPERETPSSGFGFWDDAAGELVVVLNGPEGVQSSAMSGVGPVFALAETPDRGLAAATFDPGSRRILLLERDAGGGPFRQTTVTVCDGTNGLFLAWTPSGWLFVYDEVRSTPPGRWSWELVILSPGPRTSGRPRYRRSVLSSDPSLLSGFRALITDGSIFILEMRDELRLLKTAAP
ncbi:MAG: hypothetical protein A2177_01940 [Spirochaetes bacterium RBG_13_68_11]|nr:MAG: hypothetical protein A2177_01940 [Spirochaetes bacterium RBG_13_68_11]